MYLKSIQLNEFRNFHSERVELQERLNFFIGDNGQGKTNLLEAVYLLSRGTSFRNIDSKSLLRSGQSRAKIIGNFVDQDREFKTEMVFEGGRRQASINQKPISAGNLVRHFPTVLFSPESLAAIKEGPEQRRILLDELVLTQKPEQNLLLREYSKCLRSRNRLLSDIANGANSPETLKTLKSLSRVFLLLGTHLSFARIQALHAIQEEFSKAMQMISGEDFGDISVDYLISGESALNWSEQAVFDALHKREQELASREIAAGRSLVGPHKHDVKFLMAGNDSRFYCSQGQQRALILAMKIAQIVYHHRVHQTYPILLLDDVLSELDLRKRISLMKFLESISAQVLVTATDLTWSEDFAPNANSIFSVVNGGVRTVNVQANAQGLR
jgi:DNA replication and repair protein RecF